MVCSPNNDTMEANTVYINGRKIIVKQEDTSEEANKGDNVYLYSMVCVRVCVRVTCVLVSLSLSECINCFAR